MERYSANAFHCSEVTTKNYSTSFSLGVFLLRKAYRPAIYAIYGFVRFADEIVDTFHSFDRRQLLEEFKTETHKAIARQISTNPILQSFQQVVHEYEIDQEYIDAFFLSMEMDLEKKTYTAAEYDRYIYGSAEVVGLMCLKVFYKSDNKSFETLKPYACKLGNAFQKVNFLRDIASDYTERGRIYFPNLSPGSFGETEKKLIEKDISQTFDHALVGILMLKRDARLGVYLSFAYYKTLFSKIRNTSAKQILTKRYRISDGRKLLILLKASLLYQFGLLGKRSS